MTNAEGFNFLLQAVASPCGIVLSTNSPERLKQKLYQIREKARKEGIFNFESLTIRTSPTAPDSELWIERKPNNGA